MVDDGLCVSESWAVFIFPSVKVWIYNLSHYCTKALGAIGREIPSVSNCRQQKPVDWINPVSGIGMPACLHKSYLQGRQRP